MCSEHEPGADDQGLQMEAAPESGWPFIPKKALGLQDARFRGQKGAGSLPH